MSCANFDNDGAAKVNILKPGTVSTFSEYALKFLPSVTTQLQSVKSRYGVG